jgi:hypothetical protein
MLVHRARAKLDGRTSERHRCPRKIEAPVSIVTTTGHSGSLTPKRHAIRGNAADVTDSRLSALHLAQNRSHVRGVIVDSRIGWTGGFGIDDKWFGDGRTRGSWRETNGVNGHDDHWPLQHREGPSVP